MENSMQSMTRFDIFSTSIYKTKIDSNLYNKQDLLNIIEKNYNISKERKSPDPIYPATEYHTYHGNFENIKFEKINFEKLIPLYNIEITNFLNNLNMKNECQFNYAIANVNVGKNGWMDRHHHLNDNCQYVFIHYLSFDNLHHPHTLFYNNTLNNYNEYYSKKYRDMLLDIPEHSVHHKYWSFNTYEDDFYIFPAYLDHGVLPNEKKTDKLRILVVGNININMIEGNKNAVQ